MNIRESIIIFSGELADLSPEQNDIRTEELEATLEANGIPFKTVIGQYKGNAESSFVVPASYREQIVRLAKAFRQECILESSSNRDTFSTCLSTGRTEYLGVLKSVSRAEAKRNDSFTYDPHTNVYWSVS